MRVVQVLPALEVGGVERGTLEVAAELVKRGHDSIVVSAGGRLVEELLAGGSRHQAWNLGKKSLFTLRHVHPLRTWLEQTQADIIHVRSRMPAWIVWLAWRKLKARPRLVTTVHGPYSVNAYSAIMTRGERVIAISRFIHDYIVANYPGVPPENIRVIPRGIASQEFHQGYRPEAAWLSAWRSRYPQLHQRFIITLPARLTRWKGQRDFVALIQRLRQDNAEVHGLIAGGAESKHRRFENELKQTARKLGVSEYITFLGQRSDLKNIMAISDLVVSLTKEPEAFGRTTLEALALGRPVIGYDHGGTKEILMEIFPEGRCPVGDLDALRAKVLWCMKHDPRVPANQPFTLQRMLDATIDVYQELLGAPAN